MHLYEAYIRGEKHPVHIIEGGDYVTESEEDFGGDVGWYNLNQKDYDYFKSNLIEITLEI